MKERTNAVLGALKMLAKIAATISVFEDRRACLIFLNFDDRKTNKLQQSRAYVLELFRKERVNSLNLPLLFSIVHSNKYIPFFLNPKSCVESNLCLLGV